jgi:DNA-binding Xre family transcriptional regulator
MPYGILANSLLVIWKGVSLFFESNNELLARMTSLRMSPRPRSGWVKSIREALGMSASAFARRLGMSHAGVRKLELAEANDAICLASLRKIAEALDCELKRRLRSECVRSWTQWRSKIRRFRIQ